MKLHDIFLELNDALPPGCGLKEDFLPSSKDLETLYSDISWSQLAGAVERYRQAFGWFASRRDSASAAKNYLWHREQLLHLLCTHWCSYTSADDASKQQQIHHLLYGLFHNPERTVDTLRRVEQQLFDYEEREKRRNMVG